MIAESGSNPTQPGLALVARLMGMPIARATRVQLLEHLGQTLREGRGGWVLTANLDYLHRFATEPETANTLRQCDLIVADGMPLLWAARLQGTPLPERLAGSDLVWDLSALAATEGKSLFLLGGMPGVAEAAARVFQERHPSLRIAGTMSPMLAADPSEEEIEAVRRAVEKANPDLVFVALGAPKEERLISALRDRFPATWWFGIGISLSFVTGDVVRAPRWVQRIGLEWFHRMLQEPRRLAGRYLLRNLPFLFSLLRASLSARWAGRNTP